jgi:hypothetical protein
MYPGDRLAPCRQLAGTSIQWWSSPSALASCPATPGSACCSYGGNNSCLYNAQIAPLLLGPTSLAGFLWYQGEQNAGCGGPAQIDYYSCALPALISDWRQSFGNESLPFGIFLLAAWNSDQDSFPLLRLVQVRERKSTFSACGRMTSSLPLAAIGMQSTTSHPHPSMQVNTSISVPRVFTANTLDLGQPVGNGPVHSPYKQAAGARAALAMEAMVYGQPTKFIGPRYAGATVQVR